MRNLMRKKKEQEANTLDPLQALLVNQMKSPGGKDYMWRLFTGDLSGQSRINVSHIALMCLVDLLESINSSGMEQAVTMAEASEYSGASMHPPLTQEESDAVQYLAQALPPNDEDAEALLSPLLRYIDSITWDKLVTFSLLVREYNLEWALAAYDWGDEVNADKGSPRGRKHR